MKIGFIGTGIMGAPMAGHLMDGGHELAIHNRKSVPQDLVEKGATMVSSPKEAATIGDVVIIMVRIHRTWKAFSSGKMGWRKG